MHLLLLSPAEPSRGVLKALVGLGHHLTVLRPRGESVSETSIDFLRVTTRGDADDPVDLRWSRKALRNALRDAKPDLVHIVGDPWTPTAEAGAAACRKLGLHYVLVGAATQGGPRGIVARWHADRVRDGAAGLAGVSRPALERLAAGSSSRPTAVIPPGGTLLPSYGTSRNATPPIRLIVVGRVVRERGLDLLFDALSEIFGDWRLRIAGTGNAREELEAQAQRLGLSSRIEWLGTVPRTELPTLWRECDAIVAPSRSQDGWVEPTGGVVLEAMAHGLAALVTRCGALPDVVGEAGMVIEEEDGHALTRALKALVEDPARCTAMGELSRQHVARNYSDAAVAERMNAFWRRVSAVQK